MLRDIEFRSRAAKGGAAAVHNAAMTPRRTVLIVTSSYAPAMIADMHRARLLAWELPALGWDVEILAPDISYQLSNCVDQDGDAFFCPGTPVHFAPPLGGTMRRLIRSSTIGWRALLPLDALAGKLFRQRKYDLVYFSTTQFNLFALGARWRARYGIPYVLDIHDAIYQAAPPFFGGTPPGLKRSINLWLLKNVEASAARAASALVSVSGKYLEDLQARAASGNPEGQAPVRHAVIPFGASERDLAEAKSGMTAVGRRPDGVKRIVYVGAGGTIMARAFGELCRTLRELVAGGGMAKRRVRIELYGTMSTWREGDRKDLSRIAADAGVSEFVFEDSRRVSYRKSLELLLGADGALILGVDEEAYMPSKLYSYALSGKPLLGVFRQPSAVHRAFTRGSELGHLISYGKAGTSSEVGVSALERFLDEVFAGVNIDRKNAIAEHLAPAMASRHADLFDACVAGLRPALDESGILVGGTRSRKKSRA